MVKFNFDDETRTIEALQTLSTRDSANIKALVQEYSVLYYTLQRRFQSNQPLTK
jgi:hypothetical protein